MKASDLRIGNWYNSVKFNLPVKLTAEDIYELVIKADGANISHYIDSMFEPILLTEDSFEDWMVKVGFEYYKPLKHYRIIINDVWYFVTNNYHGLDGFWFSFVI